MTHDLTSVKVAALVAPGFERDQLLEAQELLRRAGATVTIVSAASGNRPETGKAGKPLATIAVETADETGFDALFLPGGPTSADNLCRSPAAIEFIRSFVVGSKPVGAIADGVKVLVVADRIAGRRVAAEPDLREPIQKAGGVWINEPVASDRYLVTAADIQSAETFYDAFALSCNQHKASSGTSLHTD